MTNLPIFTAEIGIENTIGRDVVEKDDLSAIELTQSEFANGHPLQLQNVESNLLEHLTNLSIFTFGDHDFNPRVFVRRFALVAARSFGAIGASGILGRHTSTDNGDAPSQFCQLLGARIAADFNQISFGHVFFGMHNFLGPLAVIGQQQETFGVPIQSTDWKQSNRKTLDVVFDGGTTHGIFHGGQHATRFVEHGVDRFGFRPDQLSIHENFVFFGIDFDAEFVDFFPVDGDVSILDEFVRISSRSQSAFREDFVKSSSD